MTRRSSSTTGEDCPPPSTSQRFSPVAGSRPSRLRCVLQTSVVFSSDVRHSTGLPVSPFASLFVHSILPSTAEKQLTVPACKKTLPSSTSGELPAPATAAFQSNFPSSAFTQYRCVLPSANTRPSTTAGVPEVRRPVGLPSSSNFHSVLPVCASRQTSVSLATFTVSGTALRMRSRTSSGNSFCTQALNSPAVANGLFCRAPIL